VVFKLLCLYLVICFNNYKEIKEGVLKKVLLLLLFAVSLLVSCEDGPTVYDVEYKVTGSASTVNVTYENASGGVSQESDVSVPWSYTFEGEPDGFVYISAQNQGSSGTVTATIYKNGKSFKTSTSSGAYVIATASSSL